MKPQQFPPLCPFGSEEDGIELWAPGSPDVHWNCWPLGNDHYLRVNIYDNGERSYLIGNRKAIQDDFTEMFADGNDVAVSDERDDLKVLRRMGLRKIATALAKGGKE